MRQKARITVFCRIFHLIKNAIHNSFIRLTLTFFLYPFIHRAFEGESKGESVKVKSTQSFIC